MANETNKWMLIPPGGPQGPVYGVCARNGWMIAPQVANKHYADFLVQAGNAAQCDPDTIEAAAERLREILKRDFPNRAADKMPVEEGAWDYVIRAVMEALFGAEFK